jgi:hypothetical protein
LADLLETLHSNHFGGRISSRLTVESAVDDHFLAETLLLPLARN